jgi:prevent-host-death family protein
MSRDAWTVAGAKAKFSELIEKAKLEGPQQITKHGRTAVVIVATEEWERKTRRKANLAEFLVSSVSRFGAAFLPGLSKGRQRTRGHPGQSPRNAPGTLRWRPRKAKSSPNSKRKSVRCWMSASSN